MSREDLIKIELVTDALLRKIEIIGEATKHLPDETRALMPIHWKNIAGMRDWVAHVHDRVAPDIVWRVITTKIPPLRQTVRTLLDETRSEPTREET
jgi:uncharacterized protein with HEPN domain